MYIHFIYLCLCLCLYLSQVKTQREAFAAATEELRVIYHITYDITYDIL